MAKTPDRILDELLVLKCQAGNAYALEQLFRRWNQRLKVHAWHLTQSRDVSEEIVQETWVQIVKSIGKLRDPSAFRGWAFRIVANISADWIGERTKQRKLHNDMANGDAKRSSGIEQNERIDIVRRALTLLSAKSCEILSRKYLDDMSIREIAISMNIPAGTVKSRLFHAREELKQKLGERTDDKS